MNIDIDNPTDGSLLIILHSLFAKSTPTTFEMVINCQKLRVWNIGSFLFIITYFLYLDIGFLSLDSTFFSFWLCFIIIGWWLVLNRTCCARAWNSVTSNELFGMQLRRCYWFVPFFWVLYRGQCANKWVGSFNNSDIPIAIFILKSHLKRLSWLIKWRDHFDIVKFITGWGGTLLNTLVTHILEKMLLVMHTLVAVARNWNLVRLSVQLSLFTSGKATPWNVEEVHFLLLFGYDFNGSMGNVIKVCCYGNGQSWYSTTLWNDFLYWIGLNGSDFHSSFWVNSLFRLFRWKGKGNHF